MLYIRLGDIARIRLSVIMQERMRRQKELTKWLTAANFQADNVITGEPTYLDYFPDDDCLISAGDIIIKRISPTYVNYIDDIEPQIYAGNNLAIVTPNPNYYPKYVAMLLSEHILEISTRTSIGSVLKSIGKLDLESWEFPIRGYEQQVLVGNYWYDNIKLKKLRKRLIELEYIKEHNRIKNYVIMTKGD